MENDWQDHFFGFGMNFGTLGDETKGFYRSIGILKEKKCPECGNVFYVRTRESHGWFVYDGARKILYCSWHCVQDAYKKKEERIKRNRRRVADKQKALAAQKRAEAGK